jgi:phage terminase large subunit
MQINIPDKLIPLFTSKARFNIIYGGRASSKSHSVARLLIIKALKEKCLILCTRHIQKSIAASSYSLLVKIIHEYELNQYFTIVENEIRCNRTGSKFIFQGLWQNLENIKSIEGVKYCWIEEGSSVTPEAFRVLIPTLRMENSQFYITFNPNSLNDEVYKMFITNIHPDALVIKINYNQNPFLTDTMIKEIDYMKEKDPDLFDWIYDGNIRSTTEATVLRNIVIDTFDIDMARQNYYGLDYGHIDPTVLIQCYIADNELYICREYYKTGLDPEQMKSALTSLEWALNQHIIADSARPELSKMLNASGRFQVTSARKSIGQPVKENAFKFAMSMYLKQFNKIHIHADNCPNAGREFLGWSYETDKNEIILEKLRDKDDHCVDSIIYALERPASLWYRSNILREKK